MVRAGSLEGSWIGNSEVNSGIEFVRGLYFGIVIAIRQVYPLELAKSKIMSLVGYGFMENWKGITTRVLD